jgi:hypothetical protein
MTNATTEAETMRAPCADVTITPSPSDLTDADLNWSPLTLARKYLEALGVASFPRASSVAGFAEVM